MYEHVTWMPVLVKAAEVRRFKELFSVPFPAHSTARVTVSEQPNLQQGDSETLKIQGGRSTQHILHNTCDIFSDRKIMYMSQI
jgi:hypothetical protein